MPDLMSADRTRRIAVLVRDKYGYIDVERGTPIEEWDEVVKWILQAAVEVDSRSS